MNGVIDLRDKMLIDMYIMEILMNHSSFANRLYQKDIINYLDREYNLRVSRNTLAGYVGELRFESSVKSYDTKTIYIVVVKRFCQQYS